MRRPALALFVLATAGCRNDAPPAPSAPSATSAEASAAPPPPPASSMPAAPKAGLQLLKFAFASGVKNKEPEEILKEAEPGDKVYGHFTLRNRGGSPQKLHVVFRVGGKDRTTLDLEVQPSWSFRTWGFNTVREGDAGKLQIVATDETGQVVVDESLPIVKKRARPARSP